MTPRGPAGQAGAGPEPGGVAGPKKTGPYLVLDLIGRGGMGSVHRARHETSGAVHAVKVIHAGRFAGPSGERALARFKREAEVLGRIDAHPGIVGVHAFGVDRGVPWCAMELVEGRSLAEELRSGPLSLEDAVRLAIDLARAVEHAHAHGVLHRDLKPENVIIARDGRPRLVDFGLAYDAFADTLTRTGEMLGTPLFMAPEQVARSEGTIGRATDVYGLGGLLYVTLTGQTAFAADESVIALIQAILREEPVAPSRRRPGIPAALDQVCLRALAKDPARRHAGAAAFADELERWRRGEAIHPSSTAASSLGRLLGRAARRRGPLLAGACVIALVALGGWLARERAATARLQERQRALATELTAAWEAARRGEPPSVAVARELAARVEGDAGDREQRERARLLVGLAGIGQGGEGALDGIDLGRPPWSLRRDLVLTVLVARGDPATIAAVVAAEPGLVELDVGLARLAATAVSGGDLAPSSPAAARTRLVLAREAAATELPPSRRQLLALEAAVIARILEDALVRGAVDLASDGDHRELGERLVALAFADIDPPPIEREAALLALEQLASSEALVTAPDVLLARQLLALLAPGERRRAATDALFESMAWTTRADASSNRMLRFLYQRGAGSTGVSGIQMGAPPPERLHQQARRQLDAGVDRLDPSDLGFTLAILVGLETETATPRDALRRRWELAGALLDREARHRDVPAWVLAAILDLLLGAGFPWRVEESGWRDEVRRDIAAASGQPDETDLAGAMRALADRTWSRHAARGLPHPDVVRRCARAFEVLASATGPVDPRVLDAMGSEVVALVEDGAPGFQPGMLNSFVGLPHTLVLLISRNDRRSIGARCDRCGILDRLAAISHEPTAAATARAIHASRHEPVEQASALLAELAGRRPAASGELLDAMLELAEELIGAGSERAARALLEGSRPLRVRSDRLLRRADVWERVGEAELAEADREEARRGRRR